MSLQTNSCRVYSDFKKFYKLKSKSQGIAFSSGVNVILMALLPPHFSLLSVLLGMPPPLQLNLIHSEVSNLAGFDVEGVINPTNAELELKDDLGELLHSLWSQRGG